MNDVHVFDFLCAQWSTLQTEGPAPIPRDSHVAVTHGGSVFVFGGSTGSGMNDFHELNIEKRTRETGAPPRFATEGKNVTCKRQTSESHPTYDVSSPCCFPNV